MSEKNLERTQSEDPTVQCSVTDLLTTAVKVKVTLQICLLGSLEKEFISHYIESKNVVRILTEMSCLRFESFKELILIHINMRSNYTRINGVVHELILYSCIIFPNKGMAHGQINRFALYCWAYQQL